MKYILTAVLILCWSCGQSIKEVNNLKSLEDEKGYQLRFVTLRDNRATLKFCRQDTCVAAFIDQNGDDFTFNKRSIDPEEIGQDASFIGKMKGISVFPGH